MGSELPELSAVGREEGAQSWMTSTTLPEGLSPKTCAMSRIVGDIRPIIKSKVLVTEF